MAINNKPVPKEIIKIRLVQPRSGLEFIKFLHITNVKHENAKEKMKIPKPIINFNGLSLNDNIVSKAKFIFFTNV